MPKRAFTKKYTIALTLIALFVVSAASSTLLYRLNPAFREEVDDLHNATYSNLFIDPMMNGVAEVKHNVPYCNTASNFQKLDVYTPTQGETPRPVVVYIHGGGWSTGDKANPFVVDYGTEIVKNNLAFISINYRLAPKAVYPAQNQDVNCALAYIIAHARELNVDATKVALLGDSAGAELAAMAAPTSPSKSVVRAVIDCYGPSDIWAQITRKPRADHWAVNYIGSKTDESLAKKASPAYAVLKGAPPFLILHGTNDETVHYDQSSSFATELKGAGVDATLVPVQNADHYFSAKSQPTINQIEAQIVAFLKQHLM